MTDRRTNLADGGDLEVANPEDYEIQRDGDGEIQPVAQRIPGTDDAILVRPMPPGDFAEYEPVLSMEDDSTERQLEVLNQFVAEPEAWANADAEYLEENLRGGVLPGILKAVRNAAGYEVFREVREDQIQTAGLMMEHMGPEQLEDFANSAPDGSSR